MLYELFPPIGTALVNYGVDRVRFPAPIPSGSRAVGSASSPSTQKPAVNARRSTIECDALEKPVCVAELVVLTLS